MTMHAFMHLVGCASLGTIATIASIVFADAWAQRHRILAALRHQPVPSAASVAFPHRPRLTSPHASEASSALTGEVR